MSGRGKKRAGGFTLVELIVAGSVLLLLMVAMLSLMNQTSKVWVESGSRIDAYQGARRAYESLTQTLEQATLNTYWDYDDPNNPGRYIRKSELHFLVGAAGEGGLPGTQGCGQAVFFQAPANKVSGPEHRSLTGLLNACGFFVLYGSDEPWLPAHVGAQKAQLRYRLMQWVGDSEALKVYAAAGAGWIPPSVEGEAVPIADNIITLVIWPKEEGEPAAPLLDDYRYDSRNDTRAVAINQLAPMMQVAMVAIDEATAGRLGTGLKAAVEADLEGLFIDKPASRFAADLKTLEDRLNARAIPFRTFTSTILLREARWSP